MATFSTQTAKPRCRTRFFGGLTESQTNPLDSQVAPFFPKALRRVLPCGALRQLAQSSLRRVTRMEISGALGQLAQSSLHRVTSMEIPAWRYQHGDTCAELLAPSSWHRVTSMEILPQSHQHGDTSMEILAQSHQHGDTCTEAPA